MLTSTSTSITKGVTLAIDPAILWWILLPLVILNLIAMYFRVFAMKLLTDPIKKVSKDEVLYRSLIARSMRFRMFGGYISQQGFEMRKAYFTSSDKIGEKTIMLPNGGRLVEEVARVEGDKKAKEAPTPPDPFQMIKQQAVMMGTQLGLGYFTETFTSGFVAFRMPFALAERFKQMTQAGIGVAGLDTTYVSSTSWYMMLMSGLPQLVRLFQPSSPMLDQTQMMQAQMGMMPGQQAGQFNASVELNRELGEAKMVQWDPVGMMKSQIELVKEGKEIRDRV
jgi:ER membrane protein complex subunit 3